MTRRLAAKAIVSAYAACLMLLWGNRARGPLARPSMAADLGTGAALTGCAALLGWAVSQLAPGAVVLDLDDPREGR